MENASMVDKEMQFGCPKSVSVRSQGLLIVGASLNGDASRKYLSAELTEEGARK